MFLGMKPDKRLQKQLRRGGARPGHFEMQNFFGFQPIRRSNCGLVPE
jgi:hypothetical protein